GRRHGGGRPLRLRLGPRPFGGLRRPGRLVLAAGRRAAGRVALLGLALRPAGRALAFAAGGRLRSGLGLVAGAAVGPGAALALAAGLLRLLTGVLGVGRLLLTALSAAVLALGVLQAGLAIALGLAGLLSLLSALFALLAFALRPHAGIRLAGLLGGGRLLH